MGDERKPIADRPQPVRARAMTVEAAAPVIGSGPVPPWPTTGLPTGAAVIRRTIIEELDSRTHVRVKLAKDERVTGHDTVRAKKLLTAKLLIRRESGASLDGDLLNEHEAGLLGRVSEGEDMLTGNLAAAQLAICHKVASSDAQDQLLLAYDTDRLAGLQNRVDRIKFVNWADPAKLSDPNRVRYADYQKAVEEYHLAAQKALNDILAHKTKQEVPVAAFNAFLDKVVNTPLNYFIGSQKVNGPVSDNRDANMGNTKTRPRTMTLESAQLHSNDPVGNKFIDQSAASKFGNKSRVYEWGTTAGSGDLLTSSLPVPSAFSAPSTRKRKTPSPSAALSTPKLPQGVVKATQLKKQIGAKPAARATVMAALTNKKKKTRGTT